MNPIEELKKQLAELDLHTGWRRDGYMRDLFRLAEIYRKMALLWDRSWDTNIEEFNDREAMKIFKGENR